MSAAFENARDAASRGIPTFPLHTISTDGGCTCKDGKACRQPGKHPRTVNGLSDATTDEKNLLRWNDRWPDANWGLLCGTVTVTDIDPRHGGDPRELIAEHNLEDCPIVWTGEAQDGPLVGVRGAHVYTEGGPPTGTPDVHGVHVRGTGAYVVAPGSRHHSGVSYEWANGARPWNGRLLPLPDAFTPRAATSGEPLATPGRVPHGGRHEHLKALAVHLVRGGMTDTAALLAHIRTEFEERCEPNPEPENGSLEALARWAARSVRAEHEHKADASRFGKYRESRRPPADAESPSSPTLRVLDVAAMLASSPPPVPWTVDPILARGCTTMLAGREGRGKSLLALALAAAGGRGENVAGMVSVGSLRTLYVDAENGPQEAHRRVHGLSVEPGALVYVEADGFSLRHNFAELSALVEAHAPDLLILDSLRSLAPGLDENDSQQAEAALRPAVRMTQQRAIATLILHHASRASGEYRGSTAIGAAVELGFTLSRIDEDPEADRRRRLSCWKSRPAAEPPVRWLALEPVAGGGIRLSEAAPFVHERSRPRDDRREDVLAVLADKPLSERRIAEMAGVSRTTAQRILRDLEGEGLAQQTAEGWVAHLGWPPRGVGQMGHPPPNAENPVGKPDLGGPGGPLDRDELRRRMTEGWGE